MKKTVIFLGLTGVLSCASALKSEKDLVEAPQEMQQDIDLYPVQEIVDTSISEFKGPPELPKITQAPVITSQKIPSTKVTPAKASEKKEVKKEEAFWEPKAWPFGVGESMELVLSYGMLEGGRLTFKVLPPQIIQGVPALHYRGEVKSSKVLDLFYHIDDSIDSWVTLENHLPLRQEIKQLESKQWGRRIYTFDQKNKKAKVFIHTTNADGKVVKVEREDPILYNAQDLFGALYFYRFIGTLEGSTFPIHDRWKHWTNEIVLLNDEEIKVPAGTFKAKRYILKPRVEGRLKPKGNVEVWFSDDHRKLLLKYKVKIKVGSVTGELVKYTPGNPWTEKLPKMLTQLNMPLVLEKSEQKKPEKKRKKSDEVKTSTMQSPSSTHKVIRKNSPSSTLK